MTDLRHNLSALSPEQRAKLEALLLARENATNRSRHIPRRSDDGPCPLSFAQLRLWFLHQLQPGLTAYNESTAILLRGRLDRGALERSLGAIIARHEIVRTTYQQQDDMPVQVVHPPAALALEVTDLTALADSEALTQTHALMREAAQEPFDLGRDLMLRARLFRLAPDTHVLFLLRHHIASDAWSTAVFNRELAAFYDAAVAGRAADMPALPIQYGDFAVWQRRRWEDGSMAKALAYWKQQLAAPAMLELPVDPARAARQGHSADVHNFVLADTLSQRLRTLASQEGTSQHMILLAGFMALLHRYSGQDDIVVGVPHSGRDHVDIENLIGFFVNTLAIRCDLTGSPTFRELLRRVRRTSLDAYDHSEAPLEKLVEMLPLARHLDRHPLFQVIFQLVQTGDSGLQLTGLEAERLPLGFGGAKFDLAVTMRNRGPQLSGSVTYRTDLFSQAGIERLIGHFSTLLAGAVDDPDRSVAVLPILTDAERWGTLMGWNQSAVPYARERGVDTWLRERAELAPDRAAVVFGGHRLSYRELDARSNRLAHRLRRMGAGPGARVAVFVDRSIELVIAFWAVLKAGAAYVPVDPQYPPERVAFMLEDSAPSVVIALSGQAPGMRTATALVTLDSDDALDTESAEALPSLAGPDDIAYVIYTSGSTGQPKGAQVHHRALANLMAWTQRTLRMSPSDVLVQVNALSFDLSVWELCAPIVAGAELVLLPPGDQREPGKVADAIKHNRATMMLAVPTMLRMLADNHVFEACPSLRLVLSAGEALQPELVDLIHGGTAAELINAYGPAEAAVFATAHKVSREHGQSTIPIGRPIDNTRVFVLDPNMQPVPVGVPGELFISGDCVGPGYLNRPELTRNAFVPNPFGAAGTLYRTGDRARYRDDGVIEYLGRLDRQVKIRGYRVELGEVESVLKRHPALLDAVVAVQSDPGDGPRLVAYFVKRAGQSVSETALAGHVRASLPDFMVPAAFVSLARIPLNPSGKVDWAALPPASVERVGATRVYEAPRTPLEQGLAAIWSLVLRKEGVGIHDDFFELGGHSLLASRVIARANRDLGLAITLRAIFEHPTIADLAHSVAESGRGAAGM